MHGQPPPGPTRKKASHERWMISYADMLTLLLALFVVLYASSTRNKVRIEQEAASIVAAFHGTPPAAPIPASAGHGILQHQPAPVPLPVQHPAPQVPHQQAHLSHALSAQLESEVLALQKVEKTLQNLLQPLTSQNQVSMVTQPLTLTIQLNASVLFASGQATLTPAAVALLGSVAGSLTQLPSPFSIVIQGYTDNQPIATAQFPSNWSLSAERAVSVVQLFQTKGIDGTRLSAQGFGEFAPVASNATDAGKAKNRRVDIVIHAPDPNAP